MLPSRRRVVSALAATAALALAAPAGAQASDCPGADVVPAASNLGQVADATLCLLNAQRAAAGLTPLAEAPALTAPARAYSARMVAENFFAHVAPDGTTLVKRLSAARYIAPDGDWTVGENIAWGQAELATARSIVTAWMNSAGHRRNILTRGYREIGIGIVVGTPGDPSWGATYTTDFGEVVHRSARAAVAAARASSRRAARKSAAKRCGAPARGRAARNRTRASRAGACLVRTSTRRSAR